MLPKRRISLTKRRFSAPEYTGMRGIMQAYDTPMPKR